MFTHQVEASEWTVPIPDPDYKLKNEVFSIAHLIQDQVGKTLSGMIDLPIDQLVSFI